MEALSTISGIGGAGTIILGCSFLLYRCCKNRRFHSKSGCIDIQLSSDQVHPEIESKEEG